ncbi:hypothetical protein FB645_003153 [Coemansia sp. IMI 203386]|nr:hypothetical protein FB645_003153 [Coemansia sp. IMI 203386]
MSSGGTFGLAGAPVTKLWLMTIGLASTSLTPIGKIMPFRRLAAALAFGDIGSMLMVLNVVFQARSLERIYGSRRFASHLAASVVVSRTLLLLLFRHTGIAAARGPYDLVASCLLQFCIHVPSTRYLRRWNLSVGDNWTMWIWLAFIVGRRTTGAGWCALAGVFAALMVESNVGGLKSWRLPAWMGRVAARIQALGSRPMPEQNGQQQMEAIGAAMAQAEAQADEQQVSLLMGMFPSAERTQVVQALQLAANDANRAVTILLDSSNARAPRS